ncbi:DUF4255 domain-containing protein [Streptomyces sp. NPDC089424]|uniref:DUF4255 domain-containing protein n=1 Tax=Streptomyces sp. NPDC089424 TaxID=3365917 RepID=UPI0037F3C52C
MSNALAIAHVTQALALLIETNIGPETDMAVKVEARRPPAEPTLDQPTISVFLYQVTPNVSQRNNDLPTRAGDGTLVRRPAAALDLHYLISAYGDENELVGQRLIGSVVRTLHEIPILPKDIIELAREKAHLAASDLGESAQRVRFTPTVMDIDETSKLWGMLHQTPYALSVVYQASLVLIDGREIPVPRPPVERADVRVLPFAAPGAPEPGGGKGDAAGTATPKDGTPQPAKKAAKAPAKAPAKSAARSKAPEKAVAKAPARTRRQTTRGRAGGAAPAGEPSGSGKTEKTNKTDNTDNTEKAEAADGAGKAETDTKARRTDRTEH